MFKKVWSNVGTRFVAVGITNTVIDFAILNFLAFAFGLNKFAANTISVSIAMAVSYFLNHKVVFRQKSGNHFKNVLLFLIITAFGLWVLQNLTIFVFLHWLTWPAITIKSILDFIGLDSFSKDFVALNTAKIIGTGVSMTWNFFMYRKYVFVNKNQEIEEHP